MLHTVQSQINRKVLEAEMAEQKSKRGFASMSPEQQARIASLGGKAAHERGLAHEFSPAEARAAGRKGGKGGNAIARDRKYMAEIGRRGGQARGRKMAAKRAAGK